MAGRSSKTAAPATPTVVSLEAKIKTAAAIAIGEHGYVLDNGDVDDEAIDNKLLDFVLEAKVEQRAKRGKTTLVRHVVMQHMFENVPARDDWAEEDDPEVAEGVYKHLDRVLWGKLSTDVDGAIQGRLNSDLGLVLCRTDKTASKEWGVYVTDNLQCIVEDGAGPEKTALERDTRRFARKTAMWIDRVPQHAVSFRRQLKGAIEKSLTEGMETIAPALETAKASKGDDSSDTDD